jgi:uncharacterized protein GlcG (DUF336 family)
MKLELARQLIAEARASGARRGLKPLSIVVLDAGGQVRAFEREDGTSNARFESPSARPTARSHSERARGH